MTATVAPLDVKSYASAAERFLGDRWPRSLDASEQAWGVGIHDVSVFRDVSEVEERRLLDDAMAWQRDKVDAGFGAITWSPAFGGAGLTSEHERTFAALESGFETPPGHEVFTVTTRLVAPTVDVFGTDAQKEQHLRRFLRTEELCCQLFSEPGAGSDLAGLSTRAVRDGDGWVVNGQKVWSSGAQFAQWGELICRTGDHKHGGLTAFLVPMDLPGITVRPIRQMSGGTSFNEVFLDDVRVDDKFRLGEVGSGWQVTLLTLAFERASNGHEDERVGGSFQQVRSLAEWAGAIQSSTVRQALADLYARDRIRGWFAARIQAEAGEGTPGPEASLGKLMWTEWMTDVSDLVSEILGPRLLADTGEWGTYSWGRHVLGAPGYRIAGGSDEIQRNIIGQRVLGLPPEPR